MGDGHTPQGILPVVGFTGRKGSGKDTAGAALMSVGYTRISLSEPLKQMLAVLLMYRGLGYQEARRFTDGNPEDKELPIDALMGRSMRHAMQTLGTEWGRSLIADDLWIDTLRQRTKFILASGGYVVITDVRFQNEIEVIRSLGGKVFRVLRPSGNPADAHVSETQVDDLQVDGEVINTFPRAAAFQHAVLDYLGCGGPKP